MIDALESIEAKAWLDIMQNGDAKFRDGMGLICQEQPDCLLIGMKKAPLQLFNRCFRFASARPPRAERLHELIQAFESSNVNCAVMQVAPELFTPELEAALQDYKIGRAGTWAKVFLRPADIRPLAHELKVEQVTRATLPVFIDTTLRAQGMPEPFAAWIPGTFGLPGWRHYLAYDQGQPIASAALFVHEGTAWLGMGGTLPEARRRGAQTALIQQRVADAYALGCMLITSETGELEGANPSLGNLYRAGFQKAYSRVNLARMG